MRLTRSRSIPTPMPGSTQAKKAAAQPAQPSTNSTAPRGRPKSFGSPLRRPRIIMPRKSAAADTMLWGKARKLRQAHTAPGTMSQGLRKPRV